MVEHESSITSFSNLSAHTFGEFATVMKENSCSRKDATISLNYAVHIYKRGDLQRSAYQLSEFDKKLNKQKASGVSEFDPEVFLPSFLLKS